MYKLEVVTCFLIPTTALRLQSDNVVSGKVKARLDPDFSHALLQLVGGSSLEVLLLWDACSPRGFLSFSG
jgi:hypothetical protein